MSNPSLLCVPYRFKTSKLYSQIPDSGLGDFTVTRSASNSATRVNAAGLIETVADNVPRLDYPLGGITAGCPALLVEPSAQNTCLQSSDFNTTWIALNSATVNTNTAISPDGTQNADTINLAAVPDSRVRQSITVANSTTYTISCFYKNIALTAGQTFRMRFNNALPNPTDFIATATIDLAQGTATYTIGGTSGTGFSGTATGRIENYGNGWYRVSMTFTVGSAGGNAGLFEPGNVGSATARSFYAWGAQLEVGSIATSYIPTSASPVTRGAETISKTGVSSLIGQTEGTIYAEVDVRNLGISRSFMNVQDASYATNAVRIESQGNNWRIQIRAASAAILDETIASPAFTTGIYKVAFAYSAAANGVSFAVNGMIIYTNASALTMPSGMDRVHLGTRVTAAGSFDLFLNDRIRATEIYPNRLTNAQLQSLTQ